ncbi:MAG TPA: tRNA (adenosine(37)-N6)-threonylcarbamoyltransferase complex ATPase subunit type 1 TsaE [Polyangia bacterium]|nr:tRNA (adenosine(37)-N6)-threonylcarbamoyltransferase complex ATPase subunit type 1 TsaE [Polyangia bacterium]
MAGPLILTAAGAADTQAIAERLGRLLAAGDVLALVGPLGAGKTTFVQGLARGLGVPSDRHVASPTFALVNEHPGRVPLVHADLYRIEDARELAELGLTDAFDRAAVAIEWLDRFPDAAPTERLEIAIAFAPGDARTLTFTPTGARAVALVDALT